MKQFLIEKLMSLGRSIISLPKSPWERSTKKGNVSVDFDQQNCKKKSKLSPSTSTVIEYSGLFPDEFWQFVDGELRFKNWARKKRTSIICTSNLSKHSVVVSRVWCARFEQRWNEGQTFQHASGNRCLHKAVKIPASWKAAAAAAATAAAIHHRLHPRKKSIKIKKEIQREDRILDYNFWITDVQKTLRWYSHLQVRVIRQHGESKRKGVHTLFWQKDSWEVSYELGRKSILTVFEKKIEKKFMYGDWLHCLHRRRFKTKLEICKMQTKN